MKLNPEELEIVSFPTESEVQAEYAQLIIGPYNPMDPTPASRCFVCD
jgi:hypothetical protein